MDTDEELILLRLRGWRDFRKVQDVRGAVFSVNDRSHNDEVRRIPLMKRFLVFVVLCLVAAVLIELGVPDLPLWGKLLVAVVASAGIGWAVLLIMRGGYAE